MSQPHLTLSRLALFSLVTTVLAVGADAPPVPAAAPGTPAKPAEVKSAELKRYLITDYGAVGDDTTLNTAAIQKTIDAAAAAGGGVVVIPKGRFYSGAIFLKKGVELYLEEDGVLSGSQDIKDFPMQRTRIEGHFQDWRAALVNVEPSDRVRISGQGQLNGNGAPYWADFYSRRTANPATTNLDVERPRLMFVDRCTDVRIEGISFQDSGFWNLHLYHCNGVVIEGLHINAPRSPSTDGIDVDSCQNVVIRKCQISNNDDDIALKGSKGPFADKDADSPPVENILIEDCEIGSGNGLLTCGSEATIVRNVTVRNCVINGNATMLTLKLRPDTPQHYSNITVENITLNGAGRLLNCAPWTQYFDLQGQPGPARSIDNITIRNIKGSFGSFGTLRGNVANPQRNTQGDTLNGFTFENIDVKLPANGTVLSRGEVSNLVFKNVVINGQPVEAPPATALPATPRRGGAAGAAPAPAAASASASASAAPAASARGPATP